MYNETQESTLIESSRLPYTFESSNALEVLSGIDTTVGYATADNIRSSLGGEKVKVRSADHLLEDALNIERVTDSHNVITKADDPSIVFLYGASFCSLNLMLDRKGNAVGIHQPMLPVDNEKKTIDYMRDKVESFISGGVGVVDEDGVFLLSGTNIESDEEAQRKLLIDEIRGNTLRDEKFPNQTLSTLLVKPKESSYERVTPRQRFLRRLTSVINNMRDIKLGKTDIPRVRSVCGVIYIPKQLDKANVNRVLLIDGNTDNQAIVDEIFDFSESSQK